MPRNESETMVSKKKILVVEDNEGLNHLICRKLSKEGFEAEGVFSGEAAISFLEKEKPSLMLLDYQMPGIGGNEVIDILNKKSIVVPFMIVTGHGDERVAVQMMKKGALDYLVKDADFNQILPEKIKQVFRHLDMEVELEASRARLKKEEERYRLLAENSVDVIWQMNQRLKITYISKASLRITGYAPDELIGKNLWETTVRNEFFKMARNALTALKNPKEFDYITFETTLLHRNGSEVPVEISGKLYRNSENNVVGFQGSTRDITERIRVKQQISYQQNLLKTLIDNIPDQIYFKDLDSKYLLNNKGHIEELGVRSAEALIGKSDYDYFDQEQADEFQIDERRVLEKGEPIINKEEYKTFPDGRHKWTLTTKVPIRNEEGDIVGLAGVNRDITQRKEQEEELLRSRYELALKNRIANIFLLENPDTVSKKILDVFLNEMHSTDGFLGIVTPKDSLRLAALSDQLLSKDPAGGIKNAEVSKEDWEEPWTTALSNQEPVRSNNEWNLLSSEKKVKNLLAVPFLSGNKSIGIVTLANKPGGYTDTEVRLLVSLCSHIAPVFEARMQAEELRREKEQAFADLLLAKEKAEESNTLKSSFLLNLSHEVRTPLNSIIGFANLLAGKYKENEKTKQFAEMIEVAGKDLIKMIDDTIDISRLENNDEVFNITDTDMVPLLNDLYREFKTQFETRHPQLTFHFTPSDETVPIRVDPSKFRKAISKILDNAGKFTETGSIVMHYGQNGKYAQVLIEDSGIGIPEELTEAVFEKFRKIVDKDMLYRGNGLGLSIAKGILESMNCNIKLISRVGEGTKVTVTVPIAQ